MPAIYNDKQKYSGTRCLVRVWPRRRVIYCPSGASQCHFRLTMLTLTSAVSRAMYFLRIHPLHWRYISGIWFTFRYVTAVFLLFTWLGCYSCTELIKLPDDVVSPCWLDYSCFVWQPGRRCTFLAPGASRREIIAAQHQHFELRNKSSPTNKFYETESAKINTFILLLVKCGS